MTDGRGTLRYVGESKNRVADRWRSPPASCPHTGADLGNVSIFHNRAWKPLQASLMAKGAAAGPFRMSVLQGEHIAQVVAATIGLAHLAARAAEDAGGKPPGRTRAGLAVRPPQHQGRPV